MGAFDNFQLPKQVVMISTADWDSPLWTNKQQIASRLAEDFEVIYVEPTAAIGSEKRGMSNQTWVDPCGVTVFRPAASLPFGNKLWPINEANCALVARSLRELMEKRKFTSPILWCYPPTSYPLLDSLDHAISCYDCVDEYSAFPGAWITATRKMERQLVKAVDAVFTTAHSLYEDKKKYNKNTHFVPNVADFPHFNKAATAKPLKEIQKLPKPVLGFVGALNYKIDNGLVCEMLEMRPQWSFVFVGPDRGMGMENFQHFKNAYFLGRKEVDVLPKVMAGFDACMIPYKVDRYTRGVLPLKFFEYLATGKPVITTPLPELERFGKLIDIAAGAESFIVAMERRIKKDTQREERISLAKENSWENRIGSILNVLEKSWAKKREFGK